MFGSPACIDMRSSLEYDGIVDVADSVGVTLTGLTLTSFVYIISYQDISGYNIID